MWYLLQSLIIFAVVAWNIHWQWTPNPYLASGLGFLLALLLTAGLNKLTELLRGERNEF
jgi:ABC-type transport system involved in cytochrome c biogenesis permease subunit